MQINRVIYHITATIGSVITVEQLFMMPLFKLSVLQYYHGITALTYLYTMKKFAKFLLCAKSETYVPSSCKSIRSVLLTNFITQCKNVKTGLNRVRLAQQDGHAEGLISKFNLYKKDSAQQLMVQLGHTINEDGLLSELKNADAQRSSFKMTSSWAETVRGRCVGMMTLIHNVSKIKLINNVNSMTLVMTSF
jgi:hypothetical protein